MSVNNNIVINIVINECIPYTKNMCSNCITRYRYRI